MALVEVNLTPEGVGSTFKMMGRTFLLFHMEWVLTREEYVPNERIVDHANLGGVWSYLRARRDRHDPVAGVRRGPTRCRWWAR